MRHPGEYITKKSFIEALSLLTTKLLRKTAINGFRAAGLYPLDPQAVDFSKTNPSEVFVEGVLESTLAASPERPTDAESSLSAQASPAEHVLTKSNSTPSLSVQASPAASSPKAGTSSSEASMFELVSPLKAFESTLSVAKIELYERRYDDGFDLQTDTHYNVWRMLKKGDAKRCTSSPKPPTPACRKTLIKTNAYVSEAFSGVLRFPTAKSSTTAKKSMSDQLPKAISGVKLRTYLEDKRDKKLAEEHAKAERKRVREEEKGEKKKRPAKGRKCQKKKKIKHCVGSVIG
jgi:hypothetical protein